MSTLTRFNTDPLWESRDGYASPAKEVVGNLMPTMATQPFGFAAMISTPWGFDDLHCELFDRGDTPDQNVAHAPSWVANPNLTEEQTHVDEPDEREWLRQYGAEPSVNLAAAFEHGQVTEATKRRPVNPVNFMAIDLSKAKRDHRTAAWGYLDHQRLEVYGVIEYPNELELDAVISAMVDLARTHGVTRIFSDAYLSPDTHFRRHGLESLDVQPTNALNEKAANTFRDRLKDGQVTLPNDEKLMKQIQLVRARMLPGGKYKYTTNGLDLVSAAIFTPLIVLASKPDLVPSGQVDWEAAARNAPAVFRGEDPGKPWWYRDAFPSRGGTHYGW